MSAFERDPGCVFCAPNKRTVWAEDGLAICSDPAPLSTGHLLVYTEDHYPSAADTEHHLASRLDDLHRDLVTTIEKLYGNCIVFEHGRTGHCIRSRSGERLCHHAHIHYIPAPTDLEALAGFGQSESIDSWKQVVDLGHDTTGYAIIGNASSNLTFYPISHELPPHHLRTLLAESLGRPELADWEEFIRTPQSEQVWEASHTEVLRIAGQLRANRDAA